MSKQARVGLAFSALGFAMAALLFGYLEFTNYARLNPILLYASIILCPPSLLSMLFLDIEPHTGEAVIAWAFIGVINSGLYAAIGTFVGRFLWKPHRLPAN